MNHIFCTFIKAIAFEVADLIFNLFLIIPEFVINSSNLLWSYLAMILWSIAAFKKYNHHYD
nr:hypothetical protein [Mesoplasma coleopterae]